MIILGIHDGHNASSSLYKDGKIVAAIQEERLRYIKNWTGYPVRAVQWVLLYSNIIPDEVDAVIFNGHHMPRALNKTELIAAHKLPWGQWCRLKNVFKSGFVGRLYTERRKKVRLSNAVLSGFKPEQIDFVDHHTCHAAASYYGWGKYDEPILVLTCDGAGDRICASVNIGQDGKLTRLASVPESESIASLYACITTVLGFVPLEHEYKLMGMAPYAKDKYSAEIAEMFRSHFTFESEKGLIWSRKKKSPPPYYGYWYWRDQLEGRRFDSIMGGLQIFVEEFVSQWVDNCIKTTGIRKVALGGGFFMNVKANKVVMELDAVDDLFIFPSCGDEMNAPGACFAYAASCGKSRKIMPLDDIYWGPSYSDTDLSFRIDNYPRRQEISVKFYGDLINKKIALLLAKGEVVARFCGREEMGARSLGNRAILANPNNSQVITLINNMIKKRDFWMPFATSIKIEKRYEYLINKKNIESQYMILTFDTTEKGKHKLNAGTHPQDNTIRLQEVSKDTNLQYWELLDEFESLTGLGGILNTSFNLHGFPIVHTPEQAIDVLLNSGLTLVQLEGYLVRKRVID